MEEEKTCRCSVNRPKDSCQDKLTPSGGRLIQPDAVQLTRESRGICSLPSSPGGSVPAAPQQQDDHQGDGTPSQSATTQVGIENKKYWGNHSLTHTHTHTHTHSSRIQLLSAERKWQRTRCCLSLSAVRLCVSSWTHRTNLLTLSLPILILLPQFRVYNGVPIPHQGPLSPKI